MIYNYVTLHSEQLDEEEVYQRRLFRVVVIGLARSGTSMMSGICEKLGVDWLYNSEDPDALEKRERAAKRRFGNQYRMNDQFFEVAKNSFEEHMKFYATPYSGMKWLLPINKSRVSSIARFVPIRVIQMWRDPEEIRQSQIASYHGSKLFTEEQKQGQRAAIHSSLVEGHEFFEEHDIPHINVKYREVLENPEEKVAKIAEFINAPKGTQDAVDWVDPKKNRFKEECLSKTT